MTDLMACRSIYVGGPISLGGTLDENAVAANLAKFFVIEEELQARGLAVFNPARLPKHNRRGKPASQEDYLEQCIWMVMQADGMVCLDGWKESAGARVEALVASSTGKPLFDERYAAMTYD
jgi:hypothetical protein